MSEILDFVSAFSITQLLLNYKLYNNYILYRFTRVNSIFGQRLTRANLVISQPTDNVNAILWQHTDKCQRNTMTTHWQMSTQYYDNTLTSVNSILWQRRWQVSTQYYDNTLTSVNSILWQRRWQVSTNLFKFETIFFFFLFHLKIIKSSNNHLDRRGGSRRGSRTGRLRLARDSMIAERQLFELLGREWTNNLCNKLFGCQENYSSTKEST